MFVKIKEDLPSSIVVFLVALPLCLGVALASGAPLLSGVISGVVGGLIVGTLSQSHVSVSGPAAGLAAVVLTAIQSLGTFEMFLMAVVIAGFLQIFAGFAKGGIIADYIPSNVILGLLSAIGIILILKQIPHAVGFDRDNEDDFSFFQADGENTFSELLNIFDYFSWGAVLISCLSIFIIIIWDKTPFSKYKFFPNSLFVVILGVLLNLLYKEYFPNLYLDEKHLVKIPEFDSISSLITLPDFQSFFNYKVWFVAFTIAIIASIETLLNFEAVEKIDPHKRMANNNVELMAQGTGNIISGLLGGLPITSVIVRSSVNINSGAQTKLSAILHGIFLLASVLIFSSILNLIPLASLAAILLLTGYKLAKISIFTDMYKKGTNQFIPFIATVLSIIFTDLLIGVLIGLAISIFYMLKSNYQNPFIIENHKHDDNETVRIELPSQVTFINKASIKNALWSIPNDFKVIIDARNSDFIDVDVLDVINEFKTVVSIEKNIQLNILGIKTHYELTDDFIQFVNYLDKDKQNKLTADQALEILKDGNFRFISGKGIEKYYKQQINATANEQNPIAVVLCCIDSRTSPEIVFDTGLGDILSIRIAGNIVSNEILGSIELACREIGTKLIVVLGHSNCGAIYSAINHIDKGNISHITNKIEKAIQQCNCDRNKLKNDIVSMNEVIKANVLNSVEEIKKSEYLAMQLNDYKIKIVSAFYDTTTGKVNFDE